MIILGRWHNLPDRPIKDIAETGVAGAELKQFVERIERLQEERNAISDDIKEVYGEVKSRGFDKKAIAHVVKIRGQDRAERQEFEAIVDLYMTAMGIT